MARKRTMLPGREGLNDGDACEHCGTPKKHAATILIGKTLGVGLALCPNKACPGKVKIEGSQHG